MIVLKGATVYCDVDDTLVLHKYHPSDEPNAIDIVYETKGTIHGQSYNDEPITFHVVPHLEHIEELRAAKRMGLKIVVWTRGYAEWAECAVKALGIGPVDQGGDGTVDICLSKPEWYFDDLPCNKFMGLPRYKKHHHPREIAEKEQRKNGGSGGQTT